MADATQRLAVTGMGAVTALGGDLESSWRALIAGKDAAAPFTLFDIEGCRCRQAAQARLPEISGVSAKVLSRFPRSTRLAIPALREALGQAGLLDAEGKSLRPGLELAVSTTAGGMGFGEDFTRRVLAGKRSHRLDQVARYLPQQQVLDLQEYFGFTGPSVILANACASGANAIGHAADLLLTGAAECVVTGGFESLAELVYVGFDSLQASTVERCRPFSMERSGLLLGEGAGFLVLETEENAQRRGAKPLCYLTGYGHTTDFFHLTQPQPEGKALVEVMTAAAREAGIDAAEIGYVNAHGTGTPVNDGTEAKAFADFFGANLQAARISSTKSAIGHTLGAAGAVEALFAIKALLTGELPPQLNMATPIPEIAEALVAPGQKMSGRNHVMSVNLGFGGSNAALIFSKESPP